jgi:dipeptidyl aminopeptidase/acylaminoacyl peptidase
MKPSAVIAALLAGAAPWPCSALAGARPVTVDDLMRLRWIAEVRISPDGQQVAYVLSQPSVEKNVHEAVLYVVSASGGAARRLTYGTRIFNQPRPNPHLRWSPDGESLAFVALVDDLPQVVTLSATTGGEPTTLTSGKDGTTTFEWSPDGKRIAYLAPDPVSEDEQRRKKDRTFVIEVDRNERPTRLWIQDLGGTARAITPADQFVSGFSWSPDGSTLAYAASKMGGFNAQFNTRLFAISTAGGEPRAIVDRPGMNRSAAHSPDGRWISFVSTDGVAEMMSVWGLHVVPVAGGPIRNLSKDTGSWVGEFAWAADSRSILMVPNEGTGLRAAAMFEQPIFRVAVDTGRTERVTSGPTVNYSVTLSRDGKRMAYRSVEPLTMGDVYVQELGTTARARKLTETNPELNALALGELKPIHWRSFDGMEVWGLLLTPPAYNGVTRLPLLVYCHGGPIGGVTYGLFPQFMHTVPQVDIYATQAMASAGLAVLFPMPRGGSGYGLEGFRMIRNSWGEGDYKDIMAGVDHLIGLGLADPDRLGVMGGSYGGFMTNWIITQTARFKAAASMCSISDLADMYYLSDGGDFMAEYFGPPWTEWKLYVDHSPVTFAANVTTPLLIQHGENDRRVPLMQAQKFYKALKSLGKTVELEIYPRGGHVLSEPAQQREIMRRNLEWFRRWLKPSTPPAPASTGVN